MRKIYEFIARTRACFQELADDEIAVVRIETNENTTWPIYVAESSLIARYVAVSVISRRRRLVKGQRQGSEEKRYLCAQFPYISAR